MTVFWVGLFAPGVMWTLLGVGSVMRLNFEWLLLIVTALSLSFGARSHARHVLMSMHTPAPSLGASMHASEGGHPPARRRGV